MLQIHGKNEGKMLQGLENLIYEIDLSNRYCSLVPRSSNDSQTHFKFLLRKRSLLTPEPLSYAAKQQVFYCCVNSNEQSVISDRK